MNTRNGNKKLVADWWAAIDRAGAHAGDAAHSATSARMVWHGPHPVGDLEGHATFVEEFWAPLRSSFPDLERDTFIFFEGESNGRVDGNISKDGRQWVTGTGVLRGSFAEDYLGIPATGEQVEIRWGEFARVEGGQIVEVFCLLDYVDLMEQAGWSVLPPSRGAPSLYPSPAAGDGVLRDAADAATTAYSLDHIRRFIFDGLNSFDESDLESMGMARWFHPDVHWYGPGGIGACLSFHEFESFHQAPWLVAFPDRAVQDLDALIAEGVYSGAPGWAGVRATHTGPYLDQPATGGPIAFNGLDWWKRDGEQYVENWVFVDMVHLFAQFGVDLFARLADQVAAR
ncbi:MAG: ester cyclase [Acidimicrobiales bacterium]